MKDERQRRFAATDDEVDRIQRDWQRELPGVPVESIGIITRIWRIAKLLDEDRRRTMTRVGMDSTTRTLLSTLRRAGSPYRLTPGEIARQCAVTPAAVTQWVRKAEADGLVTREASADDARSVEVQLAVAGHAELDRSIDTLLTHEASLVEMLTPGQREELAGLLRVMLSGLRGDDGRPQVVDVADP